LCDSEQLQQIERPSQSIAEAAQGAQMLSQRCGLGARRARQGKCQVKISNCVQSEPMRQRGLLC
jgi:hypothetical protein